MPELTQTELIALPHVNALVRSYYRGPENNDIDIDDDQGEGLFALAHAERKSGVSVREINRLLASDLLQFLDASILLDAMGAEELVGTLVPAHLIPRVDFNIRQFLTYFIDASTGSPVLE